MKKIYSILFALIFANVINAQCPTFSINAPSGNVVGCSPPTVPLNAVNTSTLAGVTYTWIGSVSGTTTGISINATANSYSVYASCSTSTCTSMQTISVFQSTLTPNMTVSPISQTLTCNGACKSFTAASLSGTANIVGNWYNPDMSPMITNSGSPMIMCANTKGVYTAQFCSLISGCCTSQTVAVTSNTAIPTMSIVPLFGATFTLDCTNPCSIMQISSNATLAPVTYTWIPLANPSASVTPVTGAYTICIPGSYKAQFMDGNACIVSENITVSIDTIRPSPFSSTDLPSNSYTINCFTPTLTATALTTPMYSAGSYSWTKPPSIVVSSNTISISTVNIPGSSVIYTVSAMAPNGCVGKSKVFFYKDVFIPPYSIVFTPSAITCSTPCVSMSPFGTSTVPISFTFTSPPPTTTATTAGASFCIPGTYTMNYQNQLNGCLGVTNTVVPLNSPCGVKEINLNDQISIAPNPNNGKFNIEISSAIENAEIRIVNSIGQEVYRQIIKQGKNEINAGVLAKGIYHYSIIQNKEPVSRGKILIE